MGTTVCVCTFGDLEWIALAHERAMPSAFDQAAVIHQHGDTLHDARNQALALVETEHVVFLDADDELEPGYVDTLTAGTADLRVPSVRYVRGRREHAPYVPKVAGHTHDCTADCLPDGNWLVVGSMARTQLLRDVGGWRDWPFYEDWELFLRCYLAGASFEAIPSAVYRAHVNPRSRNRAPSIATKNQIHDSIVAAVRPWDVRAAEAKYGPLDVAGQRVARLGVERFHRMSCSA